MPTPLLEVVESSLISEKEKRATIKNIGESLEDILGEIITSSEDVKFVDEETARCAVETVLALRR